MMARDAVKGLPDAIAVHAAPDVVYGAFVSATWRDKGDPGWQAWDPSQRAWTWHGSTVGLLPTMPIEIELYPGLLYLSHGVRDSVWSVEMTRRLEARLRRHGRSPEVHYLSGQDHAPEGEHENEHNRRLVAFLRSNLDEV